MTGTMNILDTAFRLAVLTATILIFAFLMAAGAATAFAATLKPNVTLDKDSLTVGDIFENAGKNAAYVLGPAPAPGKELVLSASTLMRVASALDLQWQPSSNADQIVIRRSATVIPSATVIDTVTDALRAKVVNKKFVLDTGAVDYKIVLPQDQPPTMDITDISYSPRTARFEATISAPSAANPLRKIIVAGTVRPVISVPVLKTTLRNGDIIGSNDIQMMDFYTSEVQPDTLLKAEDVIGMTPRRMAMAGKQLSTLTLQSPQLVDRGDAVTIVFKEGPLSLTALGKALQPGARGDVIKVVNNASKRTVDATVLASHEVTVKE